MATPSEINDTPERPEMESPSPDSSSALSWEPIKTQMTRGSIQGFTTDVNSDLAKIATVLTRAHTRRSSLAATGELQPHDTAAELDMCDPRLNPQDPQFDFFLWARKFMRLLEAAGRKRRRTGFTFKDLEVSGTGAALQLQSTVGSFLTAPARLPQAFTHGPEKTILRKFNGTVRSGEMLLVLGRPGSGCSTFLKTICGELAGLKLSKSSCIEYDGIPQKVFKKELRGEVIYNQENDTHFPHLTVGQTLQFAAECKVPHARLLETPRRKWAQHMAAVVMNIFGLAHTRNTKVGNDFVRGVSGGERKRVSIAEMALAGAPVAAWDNSTRGLDAATAFEFVNALKISSMYIGTTHAVAIYQASQSIYDIFSKVIVLYEGRQIYFGPAGKAKAYFETMGWECPSRQTTGDFLTSVTNPVERRARPGFEARVPRTPDEFERYWLQSPDYAAVIAEIDEVAEEYPSGGPALQMLRDAHRDLQSNHVNPKSPYTISIPMQVRLCIRRFYQRLWNDRSTTLAQAVARVVQALIVGSIFYDTPKTTGSFFAKGSVLFFCVLLNALQSIVEISSLYAQRPIVEKHASWAMYYPFSEAIAGIVADLPIKFVIAVAFNVILYFLGGLRMEASCFFIFFLFNFVAMLTMSAIFRTLAAGTKKQIQAFAIAGVTILAIAIYTGFTLKVVDMHPWFRWINYINPVGYAFEALLVNEVHHRSFPCASTSLVPPYGQGDYFQCAIAGAVAGQIEVSGDAWVESSYGYRYSHLWRNLGILFAFQFFFYAVYLVITELNSKTNSTAEFLVFRRGHVPKYMLQQRKDDEEKSSSHDMDDKVVEATEIVHEKSREATVMAIPPQKDIFTWRDVTLDITIKKEPRRLLDHISGWVKPGTLTALMGVSGAGKTTLLDALAQRTNVGVLTGDMLVNGRPLDASFQRKTGYVQQQDLHLETATVREALRFSAILRQPASVSVDEKYAFVEEVIKMLNMEDFSEAIVGTPGEGLNVEQRKLLTIGVELAAKPKLLLFLDEPTSGLDSQSSWSIISFLRKLADNGQAVLSTIHQPSAILFQQFDRLLFLAKGGRTVYFGDIGPNSRTLLDYFEAGGARHCGDEENPAEYMLETVGGHNKANIDWAEVWRASQQSRDVQDELDRIHAAKASEPVAADGDTSEFAMPLTAQLRHVLIRVFQQYWRTPTYIFAKLFLGLSAGLFIGFSFFKPDWSLSGLQTHYFGIFMITTIFSTLVQQIMPNFITQRSLYEVRERPSKAYSWSAFLTANIVVEIPYQILLAVVVYGAWYFPVFGQHQSSDIQGLMLLFLIQFMLFSSTFAHMVVAALPNAPTAGNIATLLFSMMLTFDGIMQPPSALPRFWIFMYRVSPMTYMVAGWGGAGLGGYPVRCADNELAVFNPPTGQTCQAYLAKYFAMGAQGELYNPAATAGCRYCPAKSSNQYLASVGVYPSQAWRNFGIGWAYIAFNVFAAIALYYFFRVRKSRRGRK